MISTHHLFKKLIFSILAPLVLVDSACVNFNDCPIAVKYVEDIGANRTDSDSANILRRAYCGKSSSNVMVQCEKIPSCYQPNNKNFCIKATDCCVAERLAKMNLDYTPKMKSVIKESVCPSDDSEYKIKCSSLLEVEEELLQSGNNDRCISPNGLKGRCIPFESCHVYHSKPVTSKYLQHLRRAICDHKNYKVCCAKDESFDEACGVGGEPVHKISGGKNTTENEFPWIVILVYSDPQVRCGGSLINSQFVLTAAHCITLQQLVKVRFGGGINYIEVPVISTRHHEYFRRRPLDNDVALVKIEKITYQDNARWICLPAKVTTLPSNFVIAGNGLTETGELSKSLLKATLPNAGQLRCEKIYKTALENFKLIICAGGEPGIDSCKGDSGGPLMSQDDTDAWLLHGIVSGGISDCTLGSPGLYTRVDQFLNWINANMMKML